MSLPSRQIHVRLSADALRRLDELQELFGGIPPSSVVRFMLLHMLELPLEEQKQIVTDQIMKKPSRRTKKQRPALNARNRMADN